jgi:hypothetical protein
MNPAKHIFLFLLIIQSSNLFAINIETRSCIKSSKVILFSRSLGAIEMKYRESVRQKALSNIYTDFEAQKILNEKSSLYPNEICKEDLILSLGEYSKNLLKSCTVNDTDFTVKDFSLELLSELADNTIRSIYNGNKIRNAKLNKIIDKIQTNDCPNIKHIKQVHKIELAAEAKDICFSILETINSIKEDC